MQEGGLTRTCLPCQEDIMMGMTDKIIGEQQLRIAIIHDDVWLSIQSQALTIGLFSLIA